MLQCNWIIIIVAYLQLHLLPRSFLTPAHVYWISKQKKCENIWLEPLLKIWCINFHISQVDRWQIFLVVLWIIQVRSFCVICQLVDKLWYFTLSHTNTDKFNTKKIIEQTNLKCVNNSIVNQKQKNLHNGTLKIGLIAYIDLEIYIQKL